MNRTLKEPLTILTLETGGVLSPGLFGAWNTPYHFNLTPFEILYGIPLTVALHPPRVTFQADRVLMA